MWRNRAFRLAHPADARADPNRRADSNDYPDSHRDSYPRQALTPRQKRQSQEGPARSRGSEDRIGERGESHP